MFELPAAKEPRGLSEFVDRFDQVVRQKNGDGHAVLTVRTSNGDYILDNLEPRILAWTDTDYTFLKQQSARNSGVWVSIDDDRNVAVGSVK